MSGIKGLSNSADDEQVNVIARVFSAVHLPDARLTHTTNFLAILTLNG